MEQQIVDHLKQIEYIVKCLPRIEAQLTRIAASNEQLVTLLAKLPAQTTTVPLDVQVSQRPAQ